MQPYQGLLQDPLCSCARLTYDSRIAPWGDTRPTDGEEESSLPPCCAHCGVTPYKEHSTLSVQLPQLYTKTTTGDGDNTDSKCLLVSKTPSDIPFTFSHQLSPSSHAREYRDAYTYPNIDKQLAKGMVPTKVLSQSFLSLVQTTAPQVKIPRFMPLSDCIVTKQYIHRKPVDVLPVHSPELGDNRLWVPRRAVSANKKTVPSLAVYPNQSWESMKTKQLYAKERDRSIKRRNSETREKLSNSSETSSEFSRIGPAMLPYILNSRRGSKYSTYKLSDKTGSIAHSNIAHGLYRAHSKQESLKTKILNISSPWKR